MASKTQGLVRVHVGVHFTGAELLLGTVGRVFRGTKLDVVTTQVLNAQAPTAAAVALSC